MAARGAEVEEKAEEMTNDDEETYARTLHVCRAAVSPGGAHVNACNGSCSP